VNRPYFRRYYEAPDDSGAAPVAEVEPDAPEGADEAPDAPEAPPAAPTFTPEDLASGLGTRYQERFAAHHEPAQALAEYGKSVEHLQSAYSRLSQGGEPTDQDRAAAAALGIELPEPAEEVEEEHQPLWGAPWAEPTTYDDVVALAQANPSKAMEWIDKQPEGTIDPAFRAQVLTFWASPEGGNDPAAMVAYEREQARAAAIAEARTYADQRFQELREELTPIQQARQEADHAAVSAKLDLLVTRAMAEIPEYAENSQAIEAIINRYAERDGMDYFTNLVALPAEQQMAHIREVVGAAMMANRPAAVAQAQAEAEAAEAAKAGAAGQRGRGANGSGNAGMSDAKREHLAAFQRLEGVEVR
jgi:hypothetical protein